MFLPCDFAPRTTNNLVSESQGFILLDLCLLSVAPRGPLFFIIAYGLHFEHTGGAVQHDKRNTGTSPSFSWQPSVSHASSLHETSSVHAPLPESLLPLNRRIKHRYDVDRQHSASPTGMDCLVATWRTGLLCYWLDCLPWIHQPTCQHPWPQACWSNDVV
jgi:hypothetical protein